MSTLVLRRRRDPFADFDALFRTAFAPISRPAGFSPAAEVSRDGDDAVVGLELPGLDAERDVIVELHRGYLVVRGERRDKRSEHKDGRSVREVRYGGFRRSFSLPEHVTGDDITASYDAGVLAVRIAGAFAGQNARRIPVTAAGSVASGNTTEPATSTESRDGALGEDEPAAA